MRHCARIAVWPVGLALALALGSQAAAKTTISVMTWTLTAYDLDAYKKICETFEKQEPSIKVKLMNQPWAGETPYLSKVLTMASASVAPDVIRCPFSVLPVLAEGGLIMDLAPLTSQDKQMRLTDWTAGGISAMSWKGKVWGLPHGQSNWWVTYNPNVFLEAGAVDPQTLYANGTWNFESMMLAAQKTTKVGSDGKTQRWGLMQMLGLNEGVLPYIWGMGGRVFSENGTKCLLGEAGAVDGVKLVDDLLNTKKVMPLSFDLVGSAKQSKFAMTPWWNDVISLYTAQKLSWKPDQVPFPVGPHSKTTIVSQAHGMTIAKQSRHKAEAYKFIKFACGKTGSIMLAEAYEGYVPHKAAEKVVSQGLIAKGITGARFVDEADERTAPTERTLRYQTVLPMIGNQLDRVFRKKVSVVDGLSQAAKAASAELARKSK